MDEINVRIQIEAIPWKKQSQSSLKIQLDAQTTIIELIDYLIEESKILVDSSEIITVVDGNIVSNQANISDFYKKSKGDLCLRFQSKKSAAGAFPTQTPKTQNNTQSQHLPETNKKPENNLISPPWTDHQSNYPDNSSISNKSQSDKNNNPSSKSQTTTNQTSITQSEKKQIYQPNNTYTNTNKVLNQSMQKGQDIQFSIKYKQGNYSRQFSYSSKKTEQISNQMQINKGPNNPISIVIIDNGRRIKFEVDKI